MRPLESIGAAALVCVLGALSACRPSSGTIRLRFPNEEARAATVRLLVEVYDPDIGLASVSDRTCEEFLGGAAEGRARSGSPERRFYECTPGDDGTCAPGWFEDEPPFPVPGGRSLVYVLAYPSRDPGGAPFLEGCTDRFDTGGSGEGHQGVPVDLGLVLPLNTRLVLAGTSRVAGAPGALSGTGLRVRVLSEPPQSASITYGVPGVPVRFTPERGVPALGPGPDGSLEVFTDRDGVAEVRVTLPPEPAVGFVEARSQRIADALGSSGRRVRSSVRFVVSSVAAPPFRAASARLEEIGTPVAVALGAVEPGRPAIAAIVGCAGPPESCRVDDPRVPIGAGRLAVLDDLGSTPRSLEVASGAPFILPTDVFVETLVPGADRPRIGVLAARRAACQGRICTDPATCPCWTNQSGTPCPCEGSEIRFFEARSGRVEPVEALTLTASNAVAATPYSTPTQASPRLAVAGQGRSRNERPCSTADPCLRSDLPICRSEPESCGCPPEELCACPGCAVTERTGVCVANDKMIDMVGLASSGDRVVNHLGCQVRDVACNNDAPDPSSPENRCSCASGTSCSAVDGCGCRIPPRVWIGDRDSNAFPFDVASGRLSSPADDDLVVAADLGLVFFDRSGESFLLASSQILSASITKVATLDLEAAAEAAMNAPRIDDVVWMAPSACLEGVSLASTCPIVRKVSDAAGCFGVFASEGAESLFEQGVACRRFELAERPLGLCVGDFDGNGAADAAVSTVGGASVLLFLGDGWGGMSFPPQEVPLPSGARGGPLGCADIDGDGVTDMVVADPEGNVSILRSRN